MQYHFKYFRIRILVFTWGGSARGSLLARGGTLSPCTEGHGVGVGRRDPGFLAVSLLSHSQPGLPRPTRIAGVKARGLGLSRGAEDDPLVAATSWGSQPGQPRPTRVAGVKARGLGLSRGGGDEPGHLGVGLPVRHHDGSRGQLSPQRKQCLPVHRRCSIISL